MKLAQTPTGSSIISSLNLTGEDYQLMTNNQERRPVDTRPVIAQNKIYIRVSVTAMAIISLL
jgi:hypothetical protein